MMRFLSLGAGVQSTTLLLMAIEGEIDRPDHAIFADTQDEPAAVYKHLEWLKAKCAEADLPLHVVTRGKLSRMLLRKLKGRDGRFTTIPTFGDRGGIGRRQCTREMKVDVLTKKQRELMGYAPRVRIPVGSAELFIGISLDEAHRMKPSRDRWVVNRWPLIERRMTRHDCKLWLLRHGYPIPPKSSCIFCPFHSDATWRQMKTEQPSEWKFAVAVDRELNTVGEYLHKALIPLDEVDFSTPADHGQLDLGFGNECEGHCGV